MDDTRKFQLVTVAICLLLSGGIFYFRFCGAVSIPPKPEKPIIDISTVKDLQEARRAKPATYLNYLEKDAQAANVRAPLANEIGKVFPYHRDDTTRSLSPGESLEFGALKVSLTIRDVDEQPTAVLEVENTGPTPQAFWIDTKPSYSQSECSESAHIGDVRTVVMNNSKVARNECIGKRDLVVAIKRMESMELTPLAAVYASRIPPIILGMPQWQARNPKALSGAKVCTILLSNATRAAWDAGRLGWRDIVDFYARHRCESYQMPDGYKAFAKDDERDLPAVLKVVGQ